MADASSPISFSRTPYIVTYQDLQGNQQTLRRTPPPKLHDILPNDVVELTVTKSDDFQAGESALVDNINPKHANTLQLKNSRGDTTFLDYFDVNLLNEVAPREGRDPVDQPSVQISNRYLMWP